MFASKWVAYIMKDGKLLTDVYVPDLGIELCLFAGIGETKELAYRDCLEMNKNLFGLSYANIKC